jgi:hypothetical protein
MSTASDSSKGPFRLGLDVAGLQAIFVERGLQAGEVLTPSLLGRAYELCVQRDFPSKRLKQARPWVEKHPSIAAPVERAASEARFCWFRDARFFG